MDEFLASVERKAYQIARFATHEHQDALDIVQDAMCQLVSHYRERPEAEWKPLFYRILHNKVMDWHRQRSIRRRILGWIGADDDRQDSALDQVADTGARQPPQALDNERFGEQLCLVVEALPLRQQQAFLLRTWEGLSVSETAEVMGCSEGSVKTHLHRAMQALQHRLQPFQENER